MPISKSVQLAKMKRHPKGCLFVLSAKVFNAIKISIVRFMLLKS